MNPANPSTRTERRVVDSRPLTLSLLAAIVLALAAGIPVAADEPNAACDGAPSVASWLDFTGYLEKLRKGGWNEAEVAYVDDAVREREDDLREIGRAFERSQDADEKALGASLNARYSEITKKTGQALIDYLEDGNLDLLVADLEAVDTRCRPPEDEEDEER